jgi:uncharacterized membrane protein YhaH (DUF805 family)
MTMGFQEAVTTCFSKYVGFQGRAARPEYWYWVLFVVIVAVVLQILAGIIGSLMTVIGVLFQLATILPGIAVAVRRLHDIDKTGWWLLIAFIPLIGALVLLYFCVQPGTPGPNQYDEGVARA